MDETLGIISPGAKFLFIYENMKLENKLSTPKHNDGTNRIIIIDIHIPKGENKNRKKGGEVINFK